MAVLTHLARRGATYVWRRTLPKGFAELRRTPDYRLSTRCHLLPEAARRARRLDVAFDAVVEALGTMMAGGLTLSLEEVNGVVRAALQRVLDETEAARALAGPRSPEAARAAAAAHHDRRAALRRALATNDLSALPALWPATAPLLAGRAPADAALLGRALLRALERACVIDAEREDGAYDDGAVHWLPHPSAAPGGAPPAPANAATAPFAMPPVPAHAPTPPPAAAPAPPMPSPVAVAWAPKAAWSPVMAGTAAVPAWMAPPAVAATAPPAPATAAVHAAAAPPPPRPEPSAATPPSDSRDGAPPTSASPPMSALLDGFLRHLAGKVHPETIVDYRQSVGLFIELAGDWPVDSVRLDRVLAFRDGLRRLPAKYGQLREFKGKPLRDAIALADSIDESADQRVDARIARGEIPQANRMHAIREALVPRLSMKAANKHLTALRAFFQYAREAGHTAGENPVAKAFYAKSLIGKRVRDERAAWEPEAVRAVLLSPAWTGCRSLAERTTPGPLLVQDDFYWTWLVLTHHPLRLEEACQLMVRDVVLVHNIWCLRIAEDESAGQQLKTDNAERLVPVHRLLLDAGFLQHVDRLRRDGVRALFPTFQPTQASRSKQLTESVAIEIRQRFGRKFYKKISAYLRALDQHEDGRVNHSLRHTIDTMLHNEDVASVRIAELLGHQRMGGGETTNRYYKGATLAKLKEAIDTIDYGVTVGADGRLAARAETEDNGTVIRFARR
ncbi:MAG TPA: tyrosine-type recombinase/integrase [Azospirillum sp.]|nr:tyrosine-type recombinase/integrase [Azospirillum sp.]